MDERTATSFSGSELERLLVAAAQDPAQRPAFMDSLLASDVLVLGVVHGDVEGGVTQPGTSAALVGFSDEDGPLTPFFTSEQKIQSTLSARPGIDARYLLLNCRALFEMMEGSRLILNPDSPYGKIFLPAETAALVSGNESGVTRETLTASREIFVGGATDVPPELPAVIARFFAQRPVVEAAYLGWTAHADGQAGYLMVLIAADDRQAMDGFGTVQIGELTGGQPLDVIVVRSGSANPLNGIVVPFYVRESPDSTI